MKRIVMFVTLVFLAVIWVSMAFMIPRQSSDTGESVAQSATQTTRNVKVPNIIRDTDANTATTTNGQTGVGQNIQSDNVQSGYTLPASGQPKDTPPDDSGKTGNTTK